MTPPAHGARIGVAPSVTDPPSAQYSGPDSFVFSVDDGQGGASQATVSITVATEQNQAPTANPQSLTTPHTIALPVTLTGSDPDLDTLTFAIVTPPAHGVLSGAAPSVTYTPTASYVGSDSFVFSVSDGRGGTASATVTLNVIEPPPNQNPVLNTRGWITTINTPVAITITATDPDGDPLEFSFLRQPYTGTLSGTLPNLVYTPKPGHSGGDSFVVKVTDPHGGFMSSNIAISIAHAVNERQVVISTGAELTTALRWGAPGEEYLLAPGVYTRSTAFTTGDYGLIGLPDHPITFRALDPNNPPEIQGNLVLQSPRYVKLKDIRFTEPPSGHNLNIYPNYWLPPTDVELENLYFKSAPSLTSMANIKATRMDNLVVRNSTFEGWGDQAIDTIGVWGGVIENNTFIGLPGYRQRTGLQLKGETRDLVVRNNYFENAGDRVIQIGGNTDKWLFRGPAEFEAVNVEVYGNRMVGGLSCFAISTQTGSRFHHNTCYMQTLFVGRLLQENKLMKNNQYGTVDHNLFVFPGTLNGEFLNVGVNVDVQTFVFDTNAFYQVDGDDPRFPSLPVPDPNIIDQINPQLVQPGTPTMRIGSTNPVFTGVGADAVNPVP